MSSKLPSNNELILELLKKNEITLDENLKKQLSKIEYSQELLGTLKTLEQHKNLNLKTFEQCLKIESQKDLYEIVQILEKSKIFEDKNNFNAIFNQKNFFTFANNIEILNNYASLNTTTFYYLTENQGENRYYLLLDLLADCNLLNEDILTPLSKNYDSKLEILYLVGPEKINETYILEISKTLDTTINFLQHFNLATIENVQGLINCFDLWVKVHPILSNLTRKMDRTEFTQSNFDGVLDFLSQYQGSNVIRDFQSYGLKYIAIYNFDSDPKIIENGENKTTSSGKNSPANILMRLRDIDPHAKASSSSEPVTDEHIEYETPLFFFPLLSTELVASSLVSSSTSSYTSTSTSKNL